MRDLIAIAAALAVAAAIVAAFNATVEPMTVDLQQQLRERGID